MYRDDDSVQSSNTPAKNNMSQANKLHGLYKGMILKTYYADEVGNVTRGSQTPQMTYDVILKSGPMEGQIVQNVRMSSMFGGPYNTSEIVLKRASKPFSGPGAERFSNQDGDNVYIEFVNGNISSGVILALGTSPLDKSGAKKDDGPRWMWQFNGINWLVNKNGEWAIARKGGSYDSIKDTFTPNTANESEIKLAANQIMTVTMASGMVVTIDGANDSMKVKSAGGASLEVNGKTGVIQAKDNGTGALKISNSKVGIGASSAEVVDVLSQLLQLLATDLANMGYPLQNAPQYASLKSLIDGIKGGI